MARPTKLNAETHAQILKAISAGATRADAAASAGVDYTSFLNWMQRGQKASKGDYFEFFNAITAAEANVRISMANIIATAAKTDAKYAVEYLRRRDPAHWGDKLQVGRLSDDELLRLLAVAERGGLVAGSQAARTDDNEAPSADGE